jgi:hypothetical protein
MYEVAKKSHRCSPALARRLSEVLEADRTQPRFTSGLHEQEGEDPVTVAKDSILQALVAWRVSHIAVVKRMVCFVVINYLLYMSTYIYSFTKALRIR